MLALQRTEADYRARVGEYRSEPAAARQRTAMRARIAQARNLYQSQAADELRDASAKVRDLKSACVRRKTRSSARSCARRWTAK